LVFGIEQHEVHAYVGRSLAKQAGDFEQDAHAAAAVVGAEYGFVLVFGVLLGLKTAVPMGCQKDAARVFRLVLAYDVDAVESAAFIVWRLEFLLYHRQPVPPELVGKPRSALAMGFRIWHTRAKINLFFYK